MSSTSDAALGEAIGRAASCAAGFAGCEPQPPDVGVALRGRVWVGAASHAVPASFAALELARDGRIVSTTATDRGGRFAFKGSLEEGSYVLAVTGGHLIGSTTVYVARCTPAVTLFAARTQ